MRSDGGGVSHINDAHKFSAVEIANPVAAKKSNSRILKQLEIDFCKKQIIPRAEYESPEKKRNNDEQYNLRNRVSEPLSPPPSSKASPKKSPSKPSATKKKTTTTTAKTTQHVNKRKKKGQVRLFGFCHKNPNVWMKSTRAFFFEERFDSPIHKLIENNKKAMLDFQEPSTSKAAAKATAAKTSKKNTNSFSKNETHTNAESHEHNIVLVETITEPSSIDSLDECIDFDDKIVSYKMCKDANMNENVTITKITSAAAVAPATATAAATVTDTAAAQPNIIEIDDESMKWDDSSEYQNQDDNDMQVVEKHVQDEDVQMVHERNIAIKPKEAENAQVDQMEENHVDVEMALDSIVRDQPLERIQLLGSIERDNSIESGIESPGNLSAENETDTVATDDDDLGMARVGQLLWAQLSRYPFWPAIVCPPNKKDVTSNGKLSQLK